MKRRGGSFSEIIMGLLTAVLLSALVTTTTPTTTAYGQGGGPYSGGSAIQGQEECTGGGFAEANCKGEKLDGIINATLRTVTTNSTIQTLKTQDPQFAAFTNIVQGCLTAGGSAEVGPSLTIGQCNMSMTEATGLFCGLEQYNEQKCAIASDIAQNVTEANNLGVDIGNFLSGLQ